MIITLYQPQQRTNEHLYISEGEYGVSAGHVAYAAQLKPGVVQVLHEEGSTEPEKYFVAGGYALTHPDSTTVRFCLLACVFAPYVLRFDCSSAGGTWLFS
jgi:hypothetical protein